MICVRARATVFQKSNNYFVRIQMYKISCTGYLFRQARVSLSAICSRNPQSAPVFPIRNPQISP